MEDNSDNQYQIAILDKIDYYTAISPDPNAWINTHILVSDTTATEQDYLVIKPFNLA